VDEGVSSRLFREFGNGIGTGMGTGIDFEFGFGLGGCFGGISDDCGVSVGGGG